MASAEIQPRKFEKMIDQSDLTQPGRLNVYFDGPTYPVIIYRPGRSIRALAWVLASTVTAWLFLADSALAVDSTTAFEVKIDTSVVFTPSEAVELLCDIYSPVERNTSAKGSPVILLVHGGAWSSGSRKALGGYALRLARNGFVAVSIDYRLAPRWKFPAQVDDVRTAIRWVSDHSESLGIDPQRIGIFGYSAGGHLACLIGTLVDESIETQAATSLWPVDDLRLHNSPKPAAICAGGPPCDLMGLPKGLAFFLGGSPQQIPEVYVAASPLTHASAGDVPTLFIHGLEDSIVPAQCSRSLYQAQRDVGVPSEFLAFEAQGHLLTFLDPRTADSMVDFFRRKLSHPAVP